VVISARSGNPAPNALRMYDATDLGLQRLVERVEQVHQVRVVRRFLHAYAAGTPVACCCVEITDKDGTRRTLTINATSSHDAIEKAAQPSRL
jgi:hypothetical protein